MDIEEKKALLQDFKQNFSSNKQRELHEIREELMQKFNEKNNENKILELEVSRIIKENNHL